MPEISRAIVLYDDDCGFCRWSLAVLLRWDRGHRLWPAPIAGPVGDRWLAGMAVEERMASFHVVEAGRVTSAGPALPVVLGYVPGGAGPAWLLRRIPRLVARGYRFVADERTWFSKPVPDAWKRAATERIAAREREPPPSWT